MINNKKLWAALILSASMLLAGCGETNPGTSDSNPDTTSSAPDVMPSVPKTEGSTTFFIEVAEDSIELPSYCSYFLTGCMTGWKEKKADGALELINLEGTNIYYVEVAGYDDAANEADRGYQITMGYNESSNLGDSKVGINWSYKAKSNSSYPGLDHPTFDAPVDGVVHITAKYNDGSIDEAGWKWEAALPEPVIVNNYTVQFELSAALSAQITAWNEEKGESGVTGLSVKGGFNDWAWEKLTKVDDTHYKFTVESIIAGVSYEMCVAPHTAAGTEDAYNLTGTGAKADDTTDEDGTYHLGNLYMTPLALDGDDYTKNWGVLSAPAKANGTKGDAYALPVAQKLDEKIVITVSDKEGGTGLADGLNLYVAGDWNGWNNAEANKMAYDSVSKKYSYTMPIDCYVGVKHEFGVIATSDWKGKLVMAGEEEGSLVNFAIIPEANKYMYDIVGDLSKVGTTDSAGTVSYHGAYVNGIIITVTDKEGGTGLGAGKSLYIAGSWNGWSNAEANKMAYDSNSKEYTYTIADGIAQVGAELQFGVISNANWAGKLSAEGGSNFSFSPELGKLHVNIVGDLAKNGVEDSVGTLTYVA